MRLKGVMRGVLVVMALAVPGSAAPLDDMVAELKSEGYLVREVERTWLGRIRIEAVRGDRRREVVFDRVTGEILRDYVSPADLPPRGPSFARPPGHEGDRRTGRGPGPNGRDDGRGPGPNGRDDGGGGGPGGGGHGRPGGGPGPGGGHGGP